ncbi:MAG: GatB/YqeY domain-containing protein, partial [Calothrix sp. SM1_5_4]|nr:GatB/YqeY domain-containing protein [Calothrix sp. SM1_5_4]
MSLREKILEDIKSSMKNKDADRLSAIRFLQAAVKNREIELRPNAITDQDILGVIKKLAKQRKDSITEFEKAGRTDL